MVATASTVLFKHHFIGLTSTRSVRSSRPSLDKHQFQRRRSTSYPVATSPPYPPCPSATPAAPLKLYPAEAADPALKPLRAPAISVLLLLRQHPKLAEQHTCREKESTLHVPPQEVFYILDTRCYKKSSPWLPRAITRSAVTLSLSLSSLTNSLSQNTSTPRPSAISLATLFLILSRIISDLPRKAEL